MIGVMEEMIGVMGEMIEVMGEMIGVMGGRRETEATEKRTVTETPAVVTGMKRGFTETHTERQTGISETRIVGTGKRETGGTGTQTTTLTEKSPSSLPEEISGKC